MNKLINILIALLVVVAIIILFQVLGCVVTWSISDDEQTTLNMLFAMLGSIGVSLICLLKVEHWLVMKDLSKIKDNLTRKGLDR